MYIVRVQIAEGQYNNLKQFHQWLYHGSPQSRVDDVNVQYIDIDQLSYDSFTQQ